ncbi:HAD-IIIC family phosphatase [Paenibacillus hamazuiensis]|uniref:HAD-IIIC family phosphatase n=1 Tax=Paenibacillus hamazuiensis TaxID=2936508 RepID=UPI0023DF6643|nr:HAD-IIIC family phosphatase [Paenibacillus hamazuiensis]
MKEIKCVVWDLDNTMWDGILAEGDQVRLKPGIAHIVQTLDARGILLSIASKNSYDDAMSQLKTFGLDEYFLYPQIGWNAKSASIAAIQRELNIGMDTILFLDDQAFERDEVKSVYPEVTVVDSAEYNDMLAWPRLNPKFITEDSARRRQMYLEDQKRKAEEEEYEGPTSEFLAGLNMEFTVSVAREDDLQRAAELTVRTNQLNSTGIPYGYDELRGLMISPKHRLWICELTDKYGSYGKIGLVLVEAVEDVWIIRLLLMSCRTVARGVGSVLLTFLMKEAKAEGKRLQADFRRTERNRPMLMTYQFAGFKEASRVNDVILFENDLTDIQEYPPYIKVRYLENIRK